MILQVDSCKMNDDDDDIVYKEIRGVTIKS